MSILVTGGAGYIGSHTCVELLERGYHVVVVDNLANSHQESLERVSNITKRKISFYKIDLLHQKELESVFLENQIEAVIHFAGLKAVGDSVSVPLHYYQNNVTGTIILCETMRKFGITNFVFSSSATVYGTPEHVPITEECLLQPTNPYGRTKMMIEEILKDLYFANPHWSITFLRYFNPIGAHSSGLIGEDPHGIPNNLMPYISQVAIGKHPRLRVFGNAYPTPDGTGVRDYIHVVDLAQGHIKALEKNLHTKGIEIYNLGTGKGYSVLEIVSAFEKISGKTIPYEIVEPRPGDIAICYADPTKAARELGWKAEKGIEDMCRDAWRWQKLNPDGYLSHSLRLKEEQLEVNE